MVQRWFCNLIYLSKKINCCFHHLLQLLEGSEKMQGFSQKLKSELAKTAVADAIAAVQAPSATSIANPITDPVTQDAPIAYSASFIHSSSFTY